MWKAHWLLRKRFLPLPLPGISGDVSQSRRILIQDYKQRDGWDGHVRHAVGLVLPGGVREVAHVSGSAPPAEQAGSRLTEHHCAGVKKEYGQHPNEIKPQGSQRAEQKEKSEILLVLFLSPGFHSVYLEEMVCVFCVSRVQVWLRGTWSRHMWARPGLVWWTKGRGSNQAGLKRLCAPGIRLGGLEMSSPPASQQPESIF